MPTFKADLKVNGRAVDVSLAAKTAVPDGLRVPLVLTGDHGETKTVMVDPSKPLHVDAGFAVTKYAWDPERTVLATVER